MGTSVGAGPQNRRPARRTSEVPAAVRRPGRASAARQAGELLAHRDGAVCRATRVTARWISHVQPAPKAGRQAVKLPASIALAKHLTDVPEVRTSPTRSSPGRPTARSATPFVHADDEPPHRSARCTTARIARRCDPRCVHRGSMGAMRAGDLEPPRRDIALVHRVRAAPGLAGRRPRRGARAPHRTGRPHQGDPAPRWSGCSAATTSRSAGNTCGDCYMRRPLARRRCSAPTSRTSTSTTSACACGARRRQRLAALPIRLSAPADQADRRAPQRTDLPRRPPAPARPERPPCWTCAPSPPAAACPTNDPPTCSSNTR